MMWSKAHAFIRHSQTTAKSWGIWASRRAPANWKPRSTISTRTSPRIETFKVTDAKVEDAAAVALNRGKVRQGPDRTLAYTADLTTIEDVMSRSLMLGRTVRQWLDVPVSIVGLNVDLFDVVRITDEGGIGPTGYHDAFLLVLEHEVKPADLRSDKPLTVQLRGLDITALLDTAWAWGPESITLWDTMTPDERGTWGAWATDTNTIPSDNSDAREWR